MNKKIKIAAILLVLALILFSFAACGGSGSSASDEKLADDVNEILKSGTYQMSISMEMSYEGATETMDMTVAVKDDEMAGKVETGGEEARFVFKDNKYYIISDTQKMIMSMDVDASEIEMPDFSDIFSEDSTLSNTSNVTIDGQDLVCEEYTIENGSIKYYFDGKNLVRMETTYDSTTQIMEIKELKGTVDNSLFEIPSSYQEISM